MAGGLDELLESRLVAGDCVHNHIKLEVTTKEMVGFACGVAAGIKVPFQANLGSFVLCVF